MKILAIDTATDACSVALLTDGNCTEIFEIIPRRHTERVLPMVDEILKSAGINLSDLDAIAFDSGPGSFTGVRVATSVAQGLAFSNDLPVIPVSSLAAIAQQAYREDNKESVLSIIDARMNEVYWGFYQLESGLMSLESEESVGAITSIVNNDKWHCLISGNEPFQDKLESSEGVELESISTQCFPHAKDVAILAENLFKKNKVLSSENAKPSYIRNEVTWKKLKDQ